MRKIVKPTGEVRFEAMSFSNGISLQYSYLDDDGKIKVVPGCTVALFKDDGEVTVETNNIPNKKKYSKELFDMIDILARKLRISLRVVASILFAASMLLTIIEFSIAKFFLFLCIVAYAFSCISINLAFFLMKIKRNDEVRSLLRYHAAEHAVINAYYELNRLPEYRELRFYSNYAHDCGTMEFAPKFMLCIGFAFVSLLLPSLWSLVGLVFVLLGTFLLSKAGKLYFLEALVLEQPTSREYKVALAAMKAELLRVKDHLKLQTAKAV